MVYELGGTYSLFGFAANGQYVGNPPANTIDITSTNWLTTGLNKNFEWAGVWYPGETFPMASSVAAGLNYLEAAVAQFSPNPGDQFALVGYSQGAMVTSLFYNSWRESSRAADLIGGVTFGNPSREAGHTGTDLPPAAGHGLWETRLVDTESKWWDFALPGDPAATTGDDPTGLFTTALFEALQGDYDGSLESIARIVLDNPTELLLDPGEIVQSLVNIFFGVFAPGAPHLAYPTAQLIPGDSRNCQQIAVDYLNSLAPADDVTALPLVGARTKAVQGWFGTDPFSRHAGSIGGSSFSGDPFAS
jgi:PE-PPE domain